MHVQYADSANELTTLKDYINPCFMIEQTSQHLFSPFYALYTKSKKLIGLYVVVVGFIEYAVVYESAIFQQPVTWDGERI